jgi:hypothetical protein
MELIIEVDNMNNEEIVIALENLEAFMPTIIENKYGFENILKRDYAKSFIEFFKEHININNNILEV